MTNKDKVFIYFVVTLIIGTLTPDKDKVTVFTIAIFAISVMIYGVLYDILEVIKNK